MPATECAALAEISETLKIYDCYAAGRGQARSYHRPLFAARQRVGGQCECLGIPPLRAMMRMCSVAGSRQPPVDSCPTSCR